jgi:hypothetical protein
MMNGKTKIESTSLLAVEGKDESNFFFALLAHTHIQNVQIVDLGGKDKLPLEFHAIFNAGNFNKIDRLGFIRDAESKPAESAFSSICTLLTRYQLPVPSQPNLVTTDSNPRIGIFIMPDNSGTGMLETLCLETIQSNPVNRCIEDFVTCFAQHQKESEKPSFNGSKARVQAYLSTRSPIVNSLGLGAKKGYWNFEHTCFNNLKSFLSTLFQ